MKNPIFKREGGGVHDKPIYRGELPKKGGGLGQFADLRGRGVWQKRGVVCGAFEAGDGLVPQCTLC